MIKYLHRKATQREKGRGWRPASIYHLLGRDGHTARCGKAQNGEQGYELVEREKPVLRSMTCSNCSRIPLERT